VRDLRRLGRVGGQALIYFEVVSTIALIVGLIVMNVLKPGAGFDRSTISSQAVDISKYKGGAVGSYFFDFLSGIVPDNAVAAFAKGDLLQIVFFGLLFGCAAVLVGDRARPFVALAQSVNDILFKIVGLIMRRRSSNNEKWSELP
jgi:aerobic C4-dicarboxylate transport protein